MRGQIRQFVLRQRLLRRLLLLKLGWLPEVVIWGCPCVFREVCEVVAMKVVLVFSLLKSESILGWVKLVADVLRWEGKVRLVAFGMLEFNLDFSSLSSNFVLTSAFTRMSFRFLGLLYPTMGLFWYIPCVFTLLPRRSQFLLMICLRASSWGWYWVTKIFLLILAGGVIVRLVGGLIKFDLSNQVGWRLH